MKVMIVDNDSNSIKILKSYIKEIYPGVEIVEFLDSVVAQDYGLNNTVDAVFTDVKMKNISGISLTVKLREHKPNLYVAFVTESKEYAIDAWSIHVNDYILKPVTKESMLRTKDYLE